LGSNCRTRGPGVKRNLSVTGFWGGVEPQCVDRRQTGKYPVFVARSTFTLHSRRLVHGCRATHAAGVRSGRHRIGRSAARGESWKSNRAPGLAAYPEVIQIGICGSVPTSRLVESDLRTWHRFWAGYGQSGNWTMVCGNHVVLARASPNS
jgi:hypothetical protein